MFEVQRMGPRCSSDLIMLVDYRGFFYVSLNYRKGIRVDDAGMNLESMSRYFSGHGYNLVIKRYPEINLRDDNYHGKFILYQSSEDRDLFYKSYIEDVLLGLKLQGAVLIPEFHLFRAHHNKVFMEILRDLSPLHEVKNLKSRGYGTYEDFVRDASLFHSATVMKPSEGAGSYGVRLLRDKGSILKYAKRLSRSVHLFDALKNIIKSYARDPYRKQSNHRRKLIIQNYIQDLQNDFKVLVFGAKYYVLFRRNRKNDFRASGSGLFEYKDDLPTGLLDFSERVFKSFETPYASLDIAFNGREYVLIEFQFVHMGSYTLEKSPFHFISENGRWKKVVGPSVFEEELVRSVMNYCEKLALV